MIKHILEKEIMDILNKDCFPDEKCRMITTLVDRFHKGEGVKKQMYIDTATQVGLTHQEARDIWVKGTDEFVLTSNGFKRIK